MGDRIYLTTCDEAAGSQSVLAYDRVEGKPAWARQVHASGAMRKNERSTGASSSVACDGDRLFVAFPTSGSVVVTALSLGGEQLWQVTLCDEAFATLAICGDRMYFRVASLKDGVRRERLVCVGLGEAGSREQSSPRP